jgi:hypothetical protein
MNEIIKFMKEDAFVPGPEDEGAEGGEEGEEGKEDAFNPEENVHILPLDGDVDEVFNRICTTIDPFYPKTYEEERFRKDADVGKIPDPNNDDGELDIEPVQWGEFGHYCPVTFIEDNWLVPGNTEEEELTLYVYGKKYCFYSAK